MTKIGLNIFMGLCLSLPVMAQAGGHIGGGDRDSQGFAKAARDAAEQLASKPGVVQIDLTAFLKVIDSTEVEFTNDDLIINGVKKDAVNIPSEKKIRVDRKRWNLMLADSHKALAVHEYLGILGVDDSGYAVSYRLLKILVPKLSCLVMLSNGGALSAEIDSTRDNGQSQRLNNLKVEPYDIWSKNEAIKISWDLSIVDPSDPQDIRRQTEIRIKSTKMSGQLLFMLGYGRESSNSIEMGFAFRSDKKIIDQGHLTAPFPGDYYFYQLNSHKYKNTATVRCHVEQ